MKSQQEYIGGGMGRDYMEKEWGITENKKE